jgi:hypothetical protein
MTHDVLLEATLAFSTPRASRWGDGGGGSRTRLASANPMWEMLIPNSRSQRPQVIRADELSVNARFKPHSTVPA